MNKEEIYRKIVQLLDEKKKHLEEYALALEGFAKRNDPFTFIDGNCSECNRIESQIKELETKLKITE